MSPESQEQPDASSKERVPLSKSEEFFGYQKISEADADRVIEKGKIFMDTYEKEKELRANIGDVLKSVDEAVKKDNNETEVLRKSEVSIVGDWVSVRDRVFTYDPPSKYDGLPPEEVVRMKREYVREFFNKPIYQPLTDRIQKIEEAKRKETGDQSWDFWKNYFTLEEVSKHQFDEAVAEELKHPSLVRKIDFYTHEPEHISPHRPEYEQRVRSELITQELPETHFLKIFNRANYSDYKAIDELELFVICHYSAGIDIRDLLDITDRHVRKSAFVERIKDLVMSMDNLPPHLKDQIRTGIASYVFGGGYKMIPSYKEIEQLTDQDFYKLLLDRAAEGYLTAEERMRRTGRFAHMNSIDDPGNDLDLKKMMPERPEIAKIRRGDIYDRLFFLVNQNLDLQRDPSDQNKKNKREANKKEIERLERELTEI